MPWQRSSTVGEIPADPVGDAVAGALSEILEGASVELLYWPDDTPPPPLPAGTATASAAGAGPHGWQLTLTVRLAGHIAPLVTPSSTPLLLRQWMG